MEQGGQKHYGNQGRGLIAKATEAAQINPFVPPFSPLSPHRAASPLSLTAQVRPGPAGERSGERRGLLLPSTPLKKRIEASEGAPPRLEGGDGDAADNDGDGSRRRRYARRREPCLHEHLCHRHPDPGETPSPDPALRIVDSGAELSGSRGERDVS